MLGYELLSKMYFEKRPISEVAASIRMSDRMLRHVLTAWTEKGWDQHGEDLLDGRLTEAGEWESSKGWGVLKNPSPPWPAGNMESCLSDDYGLYYVIVAPDGLRWVGRDDGTPWRVVKQDENPAVVIARPE